MKKLFVCLLALALLILPGLATEAEAVEISGAMTETITWNYDIETKTMVFSGVGELKSNPDFDMREYYMENDVEHVVISEGITAIGDFVFSGCESILTVSIPDGVTTIGMSAFDHCGFATSIPLPNSVTIIGEFAFGACHALRDLVIPEKVCSIGPYAFYKCFELTELHIPEGVTSIEAGTFFECINLTSLTIPETVTTIGESAFDGCCSMERFYLPDSITSIEKSVFNYCESMAEIELPAGVTYIGEYAFNNCSSLTDITFPDQLAVIDEWAFWECKKLRSITFTGNAPEIPQNAFEKVKANAFYPGDNDTWIAAVMQNYGGELCWYEIGTEPPVQTPFTDVPKDAYYFAPVLWAVEKGITNGLSETSFGPDATCTRGQIVTFLWRAKGSPEPQMAFNPFSDVSSSDYFYKAVLWAVEKGITSGMGDGSFAPNAPCTRGQVATFLWRSQGKPASGGSNAFTDIAPGAYYYDAVLWAVENGITNGMGDGTFAPDAPCTRGQIVTFLYRAMA